MTNTPRAQRIQSILDSRRPMADKADATLQILSSVQASLQSFKTFIPTFVSKLDGEPAQNVSNLLPAVDDILASITQEQSKLFLISSRFRRNTLNIGMAGRARQGKSHFLQVLTGLTPAEIPTGNLLHCTGAPSMIYNSDTQNTYADIEFHTVASFLADVINPFFERLQIGTAPASLSAFRNYKLPDAPSANSKDPVTDAEFLKKLKFFQANLDGYEQYLTGEIRRITQAEIRSYIAQDDPNGKRVDASGKPFCKWIGVKLAKVYCKFPYQDLGSIAFADTPGIGDFVSGADGRLISMIGQNLDSVFFVRMPETVGAMVKPEDTALHNTVSEAIRDLCISDWTYYIINKNTQGEGCNVGQIASYQNMLADSVIKTKETLVVDCNDSADVETALNRLLNDIAANLGNLDQILFQKHSEGLRGIGASIKAFADRAANALPKMSEKAPDQNLLNSFFDSAWRKITINLKNLAKVYRDKKDEEDQDFLDTFDSIFRELEKGNGLSSDITQIEEEIAAEGGEQMWHGNQLNKFRVRISQAFEGLDACLKTSFEKLRNEIANILKDKEGGNLAFIESSCKSDFWGKLREQWDGFHEGTIIQKAIDKLLAANLSFAGFIQPRVRACLDVLDGESTAGASLSYTQGDNTQQVMEKLDIAWAQACHDSKMPIRNMAKEPSMARFATVADFRDAIVNEGGARAAEKRWGQFYYLQRNEIWPDQFQQLEINTKLRQDWVNAVKVLTDSSTGLLNNRTQ